MKFIAMLFCSLFFVGCFSTEQARHADKQSGFLKDYSMLKEGEGDEALLVYKNPKADWQKYTKIMIDPVQVWAGKDSDVKKLSKEDLKNVTALINSAIEKAFKKDFQIVTTPGADTLNLKVALTDGESSSPVSDTLSSVIPVGVALSFLTRAAVGHHLAVGKASVEAELVDSVTNERLLAGMDTRYGGKGIKGKFDSWADVHEAFEFWATRLNKKLVNFKK